MESLVKISAIALIVFLVGCKADADESAQHDQSTVATATKPEITVYKSPTCGCCKEWVTYLEEEGFAVSAIDHDNVDQIKVELGLPHAELR